MLLAKEHEARLSAEKRARDLAAALPGGLGIVQDEGTGGAEDAMFSLLAVAAATKHPATAAPVPPKRTKSAGIPPVLGRHG